MCPFSRFKPFKNATDKMPISMYSKMSKKMNVQMDWCPSISMSTKKARKRLVTQPKIIISVGTTRRYTDNWR